MQPLPADRAEHLHQPPERGDDQEVHNKRQAEDNNIPKQVV